jgi:hypothetical protein
MNSSNKLIFASMLSLSLAGFVPAFGQDPNPSTPPSSGGWRKFDPSNQADAPAPTPDYQEPQVQSQPAPPPPGYQPPANGGYQAPPPGYRAPNGGYPAPSNGVYQPPPPVSYPVTPGPFTIPAGTWISVRMNQALSSDHNQPGDYFTATLIQPIVYNGRVIAHRGQLVSGVVSEAKKAGRVEGVSRLGVELTELTLVDGNQVHVKTTLVERRGNTSFGRDAFGIGATTGVGAAIGAGVNGGVGAGVGAAAGLVAGTVGVLLTRGRQTLLYPETPLTFRLETPLAVTASLDSFPQVTPQDYDNGGMRRPGPAYGYGQAGPPAPPPAYGYPAPYYYPYYGGFGPYAGYFWGPSFGFYYGRGFYGRGFGRW